MNTKSTSLPEPKSIELSNGGRAILLPNLDLGIYTHGNPKGIFLEADDFQAIVRESSGGVKRDPLQFPELPEDESWHNPDNITPHDVEVDKGWRLLLKSEAQDRQQFHSDNAPDAGKFHGWLRGSEKWSTGLNGLCLGITYRTRAPLPTPKAKEEPKPFQELKAVYEQGRDQQVGKAAVASFLRKCRVIVLSDPIFEWEPFGKVAPIIVLTFGKKEGHGEINPDGEYESYLDGKTFKVQNIISITP